MVKYEIQSTEGKSDNLEIFQLTWIKIQMKLLYKVCKEN